MSAEAQLRRYHQLVQMLAALARSSGQVDAVVQTVHRQAGTLFPAQVTLLALRRPGGDWLWELYEGEQRYTQHLPFYPEGILETVLGEGALSIPDIDAYLDAHPVRARRLVGHEAVVPNIRGEEGENPAAEDRPALSMLFVPLEVQGARVGVLSVQSYAAGAFDDTDLQVLDLLGQHVSIALENAALREELTRASLTDALTGLANRRAFGRDAALALDTARRGDGDLTLVMLDVHNFKAVNDTFGHPVGDAVLCTLGQVLREALPAPGAAFRLSGDEFALLVWCAEDRLGDLEARIARGLRAADWPPGVGPVCLQGGAAGAPPTGTLQDWLSRADARMYGAKRQRSGLRGAGWGLDFGRRDAQA